MAPISLTYSAGEVAEIPFTIANTDSGVIGDPGTLTVTLTPVVGSAVVYTWTLSLGPSSPNLVRASAGTFTAFFPLPVATTAHGTIVTTGTNAGATSFNLVIESL